MFQNTCIYVLIFDNNMSRELSKICIIPCHSFYQTNYRICYHFPDEMFNLSLLDFFLFEFYFSNHKVVRKDSSTIGG